ncbi:nucleotide-binding protein [Solidesulfovibrio sp.]
MIVAIASGKGGTGKTTVSASLATVWSQVLCRPVTAVDLDVEEPNLHLFLHPVIRRAETATVEVPVVADPAACSDCGACRELCQYGAVTVMAGKPLIFPDMCHGCGGCLAVCPTGTLAPGTRELGRIEEGTTATAAYLAGHLRIGEAQSPPLIRAVLGRLAAVADPGGDVILDAPPGVSCPAVNSVSQADVIVLVAEPTPFGMHDFALAVEAFTPLGKPMAVVINRSGEGTPLLLALCRKLGLPILADIPDDRAVAETYARGGLLADVGPHYRAVCHDLARSVAKFAEEAAHA